MIGSMSAPFSKLEVLSEIFSTLKIISVDFKKSFCELTYPDIWGWQKNFVKARNLLFQGAAVF